MNRYPEPLVILCAQLRGRGIRTVMEYENGCIPLPACAKFISLGNAEISTGRPFTLGDEPAAGVTVKLRIRMHALRNASEQELLDLWFDEMLPVLAEAGLAVRQVSRGEIRYDSKIDRLVCEVILTLEGLLRKSGLQSRKEADLYAPAR